MANDKTIQKSNIVHGDNAGNDIIKNGDKVDGDKYVVNYSSKKSKLQELFEKFEYEKENDIRIKTIIEDLEHFSSQRKGEVIGLEQKLINGKRETIIDYAMDCKDYYARKLYRYEFYESAQKINVYLLALVESYYHDSIFPLIKQGLSEPEIGKLVQDKIINPLLAELDGDTLGFSAKDIQGMLYLLTGNCHIKWN